MRRRLNETPLGGVETVADPNSLNSRHPFRMENRPPMQQSDNLSRALLVLILICLVVLVARSGERDAENDPSAAVVPAEFSPRYDVRMIKLQRGMPIMLRTDTATGESWTMGLLAAGEWKVLLEGADQAPCPADG
jgi:hypothetical protein